MIDNLTAFWYIVFSKEAQAEWRSVEFPPKWQNLRIIHLEKAMNGVIKTLTDKGFGFITPDGESKDLFFHSSALVDITYDELEIGDKVSFETEESPKGLRAANVQRA